MAGGSWWESSPGLRQVFPAIVNAASQGASTAEVWSAIRDSAATIAGSTLGVTLGRTATDAEISAKVADILQGVSATQVSQARGAAGGIVQAHNNLLARGTEMQIMSDSIARPPWSQTADVAGIQEQYRIRIQREITFHGFTDVSRVEWATYELAGSLTSMADAIATANTLFGQADYNRNVSINGILDYSIEAI